VGVEVKLSGSLAPRVVPEIGFNANHCDGTVNNNVKTEK